MLPDDSKNESSNPYRSPAPIAGPVAKKKKSHVFEVASVTLFLSCVSTLAYSTTIFRGYEEYIDSDTYWELQSLLQQCFLIAFSAWLGSVVAGLIGVLINRRLASAIILAIPIICFLVPVGLIVGAKLTGYRG